MSEIIIKDGKLYMSENGALYEYVPPEAISVPPETGPMLMDIILKQAELEQKIDAIGIMLVPDIPEV